MSELPKTLANAAEAVRAGRATPRELTEACLDRIRRLDDEIRAWVTVDEENARRDAEKLGAELAGGRPPRSPLHGIPIGVKDIYDVMGIPTLAGSPLRRGHVAAADAAVVARLRRAGAIILGKTVTTEFACFEPSPTRNPWNLAHTPGGSSSGSAAVLAAGMCFAALGSQTGGSITRPASFCGVCGLKPTFGRLSVQGVVPVSFHLDHVGPLAATVGDLAIVWSVLADEEATFVDDADKTPPPRLAVLGGFFDERADEEVRAATAAALDRLKAAGAVLEPRRLAGDFLEVHAVHRRIMAVEAAEYHRHTYAAHPEQYGASISALIEEGQSVSAVDYAAALKFQAAFRVEARELLSGVAALVTPATVTPAPASPDTTGDPAFNSPWSLCGLPTISFPCGLSRDGMPCGLQLIGAWRGERELFQTAAWIERQLAFRATPGLQFAK